MKENMQLFAFWACLTSLSVMFSSSIHLFVSVKISFFVVE
jgi:hypothetical protein